MVEYTFLSQCRYSGHQLQGQGHGALYSLPTPWQQLVGLRVDNSPRLVGQSLFSKNSVLLSGLCTQHASQGSSQTRNLT